MGGGHDIMLAVESRRPRRRILCSFIIALALAVAGRAVPECTNLEDEDDVSNDGDVVSCAEVAVPRPSLRRLTLSEVVQIKPTYASGDRLPIWRPFQTGVTLDVTRTCCSR